MRTCRLSMSWSVLAAAIALFASMNCFACTPSAPRYDTNGKLIPTPPRTFQFSFIGIVEGEAPIVVTSMFNKRREITALRIRVIESASTETAKDTVYTVYAKSLNGHCSVEPSPLTLRSFPIGAKVRIKTDNLENAEEMYYVD